MQTAKDRPTVTVRRPRSRANRAAAQGRRKSEWFLYAPGIDMYAEGGNLITEVLLPEFEPDEIEVTATSDAMEVSAFRKAKVSDEPKNRTYFMHNGRWSFWRRVSLPVAAKPEGLKYRLRDGKLRITMPMDRSKMSDPQVSNYGKEMSYDLHRTTSPPKPIAAIVQTDQEFPNHWTWYRPVR